MQALYIIDQLWHAKRLDLQSTDKAMQTHMHMMQEGFREHFNKKTKPKPRHSNNFKNFTVTKYIAKHAQPFVIHIYRNTVQFLHKTQFLTSSNICKYVHRSAGDSLTKLGYVAQKPKLMALFHCMVRYGSARLGTVRYGSVRVGLHFHCSLVPL